MVGSLSASALAPQSGSLSAFALAPQSGSPLDLQLLSPIRNHLCFVRLRIALTLEIALYRPVALEHSKVGTAHVLLTKEIAGCLSPINRHIGYFPVMAARDAEAQWLHKPLPPMMKARFDGVERNSFRP